MIIIPSKIPINWIDNIGIKEKDEILKIEKLKAGAIFRNDFCQRNLAVR